MTYKILVVDDHALFRKLVADLLSKESDIEVVGQAGNGFEALELTRKFQPDLILMDIYMPGMDGITAMRLIRSEFPNIKIVILSMSSEEKDVVEAIQSGARGYIVKSTSVPEFVAQIREALAGNPAMSVDLVSKLITGLAHGADSIYRRTKKVLRLSERENNVLALIARGASNEQIAQTLSISVHTVRAHTRSMMQKLGAENRTQLAVYGVQQGFGVKGRSAFSSSSHPPSAS